MKKDFFWISYSDLMTSLFFIMMVLFLVTVLKLDREKRASEEVIEKINEIQTALESLDSTYYQFDDRNKRYKLSQEADFFPSEFHIDSMYNKDITQAALLRAGEELYHSMAQVIQQHPNTHFLLIIEGNTQRIKYYDRTKGINEWNYLGIPNDGYRLSYKRALSLFNYWKDNEYNFYNLAPKCEVIIAGSGYFGQSREKDEQRNRKFSIQVTSKFGEYIKEISDD